MSQIKDWTVSLLAVFHNLKDENLKWQQQNQEQCLKIKHRQVLAEKQLEAELKKRSLELQHEIALLQTENAAQLTMLKTKCQQEIKDYKQYLNSLDKLKMAIQKSYPHLPEAVAFTIHHHAKQLLNQMWEAEDFQAKIQLEMQLINFMTTVHEESRLFLKHDKTESLPEKTLALIQTNSN